MDILESLSRSTRCSLYEIKGSSDCPIKRYLVSTPETRAICNDPFFVGIDYTTALRKACAETLKCLGTNGPFPFDEVKTTILHILRGGLNFGLREAFHDTFQWNHHSSAFISAQRARRSGSLEDWHITESSYRKVYLSTEAEIVFGDVVATGTSLEFALTELLGIVEKEGVTVGSVLFFTIGGKRAEEILLAVDKTCRDQFKSYRGAAVVYFEGRFGVAFPGTPLKIKIPGTDLLRRDGFFSPEFIESQYENVSFPLERCAIYDAGSRAFWLPEYLEDLWDYWEQTFWLASGGVGFKELLSERAPDLDPKRFPDADLKAICARQIKKCEDLVSGMALPRPSFKKE